MQLVFIFVNRKNPLLSLYNIFGILIFHLLKYNVIVEHSKSSYNQVVFVARTILHLGIYIFLSLSSTLILLNAGDEPSNIEVEKLLQDVEKYTLASHLVWGLWGIISVLLLFSS